MSEKRDITEEEKSLFESATGKQFTRRSFLKWSSALAGAAIASGILWDDKLGLFREASAQEKGLKEGEWIYSNCNMCGGQSGIKVKVVNGRAVKIEGIANPNNIANISTNYEKALKELSILYNDKDAAGRICSKGNSGLRALYDPDRLKTPMVRVGKKGSGKWKAISWDDAISQVADNLGKIRDKYGAESLAWFSEDHCFTHIQQDFCKMYGTPNYHNHSNLCDVARKASFKLVMGNERPLADFEDTSYALVFGWNLLGATKWILLPGIWNRGRAKGAKMVYVDPFCNQTAAKADQWVPIRPGTDGAFALALGHVLIKKDLINKAFIDEWCVGYDEYAKYVADKTPEWAEKITSIPARTIEQIATEMGELAKASKPVCIDTWSGPGHHTNATLGGYAITVLPALLGMIDKPGTIMEPSKIGNKHHSIDFDTPSLKKPRVDGKGTKYILGHGSGIYVETRDVVLGGKESSQGSGVPKTGVFVYQNFVMSVPNTKKNMDFIKKLEYVVVNDTHMSETAELADIVIPGSVYLERYDFTGYWVTWPVLGLRKPVVKSVINGMTEVEFWMAVMKKMGMKDKKGYSPAEQSYDAYYADEYNPTAYAKEQNWETYRKSTLAMTGKTEYEKFRKEVKPPEGGSVDDKTGLVKDKDGKAVGVKIGVKIMKGFDTPSRKLEITSTFLKKNKHTGLPEYSEPEDRPTADFPLYLINFKQNEHTHSRTFNNDYLMEMKPDNPLLINSATASKLGLKDGDAIWIESPYAKAKGTVQITERIHPEVVALQHGYGHWGFGKVAKGSLNKINKWSPAGTNDGQFFAGKAEKLSGQIVAKEIGVKLVKA
ncbi:Molybdopterin oxidoreductase, 4Fe-4S domain [Candidatus Sulfobium mesophilum]|uniref:Molybdopterin oxidoreductase, 4Fe-4S domain n=1 Tax=Candidatus Sulfobium mesophilum TaxID=2016548 RepID=A0A2U3QKS3_9BACT|nr:Molybdopterin oxidoreductase, 4Fe-4S domain [Candidatus Sulfobium mesophilum]